MCKIDNQALSYVKVFEICTAGVKNQAGLTLHKAFSIRWSQREGSPFSSILLDQDWNLSYTLHTSLLEKRHCTVSTESLIGQWANFS